MRPIDADALERDINHYCCGNDHFKHWVQIQRTIKVVTRLGRWKQVRGDFVTPGGTPYFECAACGGSGHLHGAEYPQRKMICDKCGSVNIYPWEKAYEEGSSLWEESKQDE